MSSQRLNDLFYMPGPGGSEGETDPYSARLEKVVDSCPDATLVRESQQWSRLAAIQQGGTTIFEPAAFDGDSLPFDPLEKAAQITYTWDQEKGRWELAWVAVWPWEEEG